MFEHKQNVTIVKGGGRESRYAHMLLQILSRFPNISAPQPITEAEYHKNMVTIESDGKPKVPNGKVIFFGNGKETRIQGKSVKWEYDRFGMKYGWLGNRCVITADFNEVTLEKQSEFAEYYNSKIDEFRSFIKFSGIDISSIHYSDVEHVDTSELYDDFKWEENDDAAKKAKKGIAAAVASPLLLLAEVVKGANNLIQDACASLERKTLWENQYLFLVLEFAMNGFPRFISNLESKKVKGKATIVYEEKDAAYAHLLCNFIKQYSEYDAMEFTEKMFTDNAKMFSANNKIIFLGGTRSAKERWSSHYSYTYDELGMRYGRFGNQAFINVSPLGSKEEKKRLADLYNRKAEESSDKKDADPKKEITQGVLLLTAGLFVPFVEWWGIYKIGDGIGAAKNEADEIKKCQYFLLLNKFLADDFDQFMEE